MIRAGKGSSYITGAVQEGPVEAIPLVRGEYPKYNGKSAYPLHVGRVDDCRTITEGELVLTYNSKKKPADMGGCSTSSFNGFDELEKSPGAAGMVAEDLTIKAHRIFKFTGVAMYDIADKDSGAVIRSGIITTQNNSGMTIQLGTPICWRCQDPQKVGNGKARPQLVPQAEMVEMLKRYDDAHGNVSPVLMMEMMTPFGRAMNTAAPGKDLKIHIFV